MIRLRALLAVAACCSLALFAAGCGGDGAESTASAAPGDVTQTPVPATSTPPASSSGGDDSTSPSLEGPASRYSLLNPDDFGEGYITDIANTYVLDAEIYTAHNEAFDSPEHGKAMMESWGYLGGYSTAVDPEGRTEGMLNGGVRVLLEVHLFEGEEGAREAYRYFRDHIARSGERLGNPNMVSEVNVGPVGNESTAWTYVSGTIGRTTVNLEFALVMFRRGNLVASVVAMGAEPFLRPEHAYMHAKMIDEKALGQRTVITPTPTSKQSQDNP